MNKNRGLLLSELPIKTLSVQWTVWEWDTLPILRECLFLSQKTPLWKLPINESLEVLRMDWTVLTILSFDPILVLLQKGLWHTIKTKRRKMLWETSWRIQSWWCTVCPGQVIWSRFSAHAVPPLPVLLYLPQVCSATVWGCLFIHLFINQESINTFTFFMLHGQ